jgi:hypothetical protein
MREYELRAKREKEKEKREGKEILYWLKALCLFYSFILLATS